MPSSLPGSPKDPSQFGVNVIEEIICVTCRATTKRRATRRIEINPDQPSLCDAAVLFVVARIAHNCEEHRCDGDVAVRRTTLVDPPPLFCVRRIAGPHHLNIGEQAELLPQLHLPSVSGKVSHI